MNKCKECGTEFEGKFCPSCGTPWLAEGEKICPKCKAVLKANAKFCSDCGYSFETQGTPAPVAPQTSPVAPQTSPAAQQPQKTEKSVASGTKKLYTAVSVLPAVLFGLFSVLLFFFFLAPVAVMPGGELMGQKISDTSYGNVYESSNYEGMSFTGSMTALIVFAAFALFVTFLILVSCVFSNMRDKRFTIAGKEIFLRNILTAIGYVLFFVLFLVSCILMGQIASDDGGLGMMTAGAAPILVLVFTLICTLAALACAFAGAYLRKTYPALVAETENKVAAAKPTAVKNWIKKHKAWTAVISAVLVVAIVIAIAVPIGLANRHNGTYYAYNGETGEYDTGRFYKLSGNVWKDENGERGKITFDGEEVTLTYDPTDGADKTGFFAITSEGTLIGDVLNVDGTIYAKKGHKHKFGDWEQYKDSTCIEKGTEKRTCACGGSELRETDFSGHDWENINEEATCTDAGFVGTRCKVCGEKNGSYQGDALHVGYALSNDDKSYRVTSLSSECQYDTIEIPATYKGLPVTSIGHYAFSGCSRLTSVTIPDSVTSIGEWAFYNCSGLTSISIPDSVTSIGRYAFDYCSGLTRVDITDLAAWCRINFGSDTSNPLYYAHHLYLNNAEVTELTIPNSVTSIGDCAFSGCSSIESISIPDSVTSIGERAFEGCNALERITIGNSVTSIGEWAFYNCSGLTSISIPNSVTSIGDYAFSGCSGLTSISIPDSVTSIGEWAFYNCSGLTSVTIPDSVTSIDGAFSGCSGLTSISIPNGVTSIDGAFSGCSGLTSISIPDSVTSIGEWAFYHCSGLTSISIPNSVTSIGDYAFLGCRSIDSITIPDSVTGIGERAFEGCSALESITIGNGVTSIGERAFYNCSGLTSISIPDSVTSIGRHAFDYCSLTEIQFEGTIEEWKAIKKAAYWDSATGDYTVTCTNGTVAKNGTVTYFHD